MAKQKPKTATTRRVAVLDAKSCLIGDATIGVTDPILSDQVDIDPGDLPFDGTYKWSPQHKQFIPLGYGLPLRTKRPPIDSEYAMFLTMKAVQAVGVTLPKEVIEYTTWYDDNLRRRNEEAALAQARRSQVAIS